MEQILKKRGRDPVKREELIGYIREQVVSGLWLPEAKLPPRTWFEQKFAAAPATVQKAFEILCGEGVLFSEPRRHTRVSGTPPHLAHYGLVLYGTAERENLYSRSLIRAAELLRQRRKLWLDVYFDLDCRLDSADHRALVHGVEKQLFAGLFFASKPDKLRGTPIVDAPGMPRVMFSEGGEFKGVCPVNSSSAELGERALEYLARRGCRRIAMLQPGFPARPEYRKRLRRKIEELNLDCPRDYDLDLYPMMSEQAAPVTELLFNRRNRERPDGLFIGDDNFLPHALTGLRRALGAEAESVRVVSHANYPLAIDRPDFPVKFFYINVLGVLERSLGTIDDLRAGRSIRSGKVDIYEESEISE